MVSKDLCIALEDCGTRLVLAAAELRSSCNQMQASLQRLQAAQQKLQAASIKLQKATAILNKSNKKYLDKSLN
jgi:hypothetical protein